MFFDHPHHHRYEIGLEILFTMILVYTILNVSERAQVVGANAALAVGAALAAIGLIGGYVSI